MIAVSQLNKNLLDTHYAVRGAIVDRAQELEREGRKIIYCNIGNPQALGQSPLTYIRQTLSLLEYPELLKNKSIRASYPQDIITRAEYILVNHSHGTGAYSHSTGISFVREAVAQFISRRDSIPADKDQIILTDGASKGVQAVIQMLLSDNNAGIMIPIPQYPLYSATLTLYGGKQVHYYLDESDKWSLQEAQLEKSISEARAKGIVPVAIAVINPGNPTGAVLSDANIAMIVRFAKSHNLAILADEVYQENIYGKDNGFHSFAKVMHGMGETDVSLFTFHSVSKGFLGECGHRGGYLEVRNVPKDVFDQLVKLQSINLCANISGQLTTYLMVTPPCAGDASYDLYVKERDHILNSLYARAKMLTEGLNAINGVSVDVPQGAMYAFVRVELPVDTDITLDKMSLDKQESYHAKRNSDYCLQLLEETGICVVPGSGFGQELGTYHFRTTFLPPVEQIAVFVEAFETFHKKYLDSN